MSNKRPRDTNGDVHAPQPPEKRRKVDSQPGASIDVTQKTAAAFVGHTTAPTPNSVTLQANAKISHLPTGATQLPTAASISVPAAGLTPPTPTRTINVVPPSVSPNRRVTPSQVTSTPYARTVATTQRLRAFQLKSLVGYVGEDAFSFEKEDALLRQVIETIKTEGEKPYLVRFKRKLRMRKNSRVHLRRVFDIDGYLEKFEQKSTKNSRSLELMESMGAVTKADILHLNERWVEPSPDDAQSTDNVAPTSSSTTAAAGVAASNAPISPMDSNGAENTGTMSTGVPPNSAGELRGNHSESVALAQILSTTVHASESELERNRLISEFYAVNEQHIPSFSASLGLRDHPSDLPTYSPYTANTLKYSIPSAITDEFAIDWPCIYRDYSTTSQWALVMRELLQWHAQDDPYYRSEPLSPIVYTYIRPKFIPQLNRLLCSVFWEDIDVSRSLIAPDYTVVVLYKKLVIGCGLMTPNGYITYLAVHPAFRNAGVSNIILFHLIQTVPDRDITLHVSTNNTALILYNKFGFKSEEKILGFYSQYLPADSTLSPDAFLLRLRH